MSVVVTIDGPGGAGKGTISRIVAMRMGWHYLDSGALYRTLALAALKAGVDETQSEQLLDLAKHLPLTFLLESEDEDHRVLLDGVDVTDDLRNEQTGSMASKVASNQAVRAALLQWQRDNAVAPGLVADGRDMGTVVFPDAPIKIYLTASLEERANRRYKQLIAKGLDVSIGELLEEIRVPDARDMNREVAPLKPADDAVTIDSTEITIAQVVDNILKLINK